MMRSTIGLGLGLLLGLSTVAQARVEPASGRKHTVDAHGFTEQQRYMPVGDPNLDPNWDWTVSGPGHTVYYSDVNGVVRSKVVQVPFYTGGHPLNTLEKDMYPADGWVLAFRDFGTPTAAPDVPFFALYNKYRGILRIMLYNSRELTYSRFNLELSFKSASATGALLTYSDRTRAFRNDYDTSRIESHLVEANSINGWIYADFMLTGYDPTMNDATQLRLQLRGLDVSQVSLASTEFTLSEVLSEANPGNGRSSGGDLVAAANQGHKFYKDVDKAAKALRSAASSTESNGKWWQTVLRAVVGTNSQPSVLSKVAPIVGGLVGFISSFIGGADDPAPREPLNFEGSLKLQGTISQSFPLYAMDFGMKYATGGNPPDYYRPLNNITWGIFNLNTRPVAYSIIDQECPTPYRTDCFRYAEAYLTQAPSYVFNPNAGLQLVSVSYAFTFTTRKPTYFSSWGDLYYYSENGPIPSGIAVKLTMKATQPTLYFDDDIVFYKVYPYTATN
jgi:hypothetical protein